MGANPAFPSLASGARPDNRGGPFGAAPRMPSPPGVGAPGATAPPPVMAPTQAPPQPAPTPPTAPTLAYSSDTDPVLQRIQALSTQQRGDATSNALALRKQTAIDYNDTALATALGDPSTAQAAASNPFGVLERLKYDYTQGAHNLDEQSNNQNLFYSGWRGLQQGNLAHNYQGQQAAATGEEQGLLGGINNGLAAALAAADAQDAAAQQSAADRAIQAALAGGGGAGAGVGAGAAAGAGAGAGNPTTPGVDNSAPIDYSLASQLFPTPSTELVNPAAFGPSVDNSAPVPIDYALASQLFPTANTELINPSALGGQQADPLAVALGLTPQKRRQAQFIGA